MASVSVLDDVAHFWSGDLIASPTGDLGRANRVDRANQRVLRRLMTNPGDYIFHPDYGAGLPRLVGQAIDVAKIRALIRGQMQLEAAVSQSPPPDVTAVAITGGVQVAISYTALPDKQPVSLSFSLSA